MDIKVDSGCTKKEEGLLEESSKLRNEAEALLNYMEKFLLNPSEKDQKECRGIMAMPFGELKANIHDTMSCLNKIRELFTAEVINRLK